MATQSFVGLICSVALTTASIFDYSLSKNLIEDTKPIGGKWLYRSLLETLVAANGYNINYKVYNDVILLCFCHKDEAQLLSYELSTLSEVFVHFE